MKRRRVGLILIVAGVLLSSFAGVKYAMGAVAQDQARRAWDEAAAHAAVTGAWALAGRDRAAVPATRGLPVARLVIPRIGLDEIVLEGVGEDALNGGPGHYPGSPLPGDSGNAIISAHRDRHFRHLGDLAVGDTVRTQSGMHPATWVIVSRRIVDKDSPAIFRSNQAMLTLTTCWPMGYFGAAPERLIVTARLAGREKG